ncbi:MAG: sigma-70 family RNA polymerase sigma factor [Hyphomicrobiales bacterium]
MSPDDVSKLIGRVALGDRTAFRALYDATSAKLFGVCLRVMKNRNDAEDVLQEVYVKIWHNAGKFTVSGYSPITWLVAVARHQAIDRLRRVRPQTAEMADAEHVADNAASPEQQALMVSEATRLRSCLDQLSPGQAEAVKAAYMEGYSYQELADRLNQPLNTVRTWLRRSLINLRKCLST